MPRFKVRCFDRGQWDENEPRNIDARNEQEAAEIVCGVGHLVEAVKLGQLRAEVWPVSLPRNKKHFYVQPRQIPN